VHRRAAVKRTSEDPASPGRQLLPPLATGIALGLWISAMLLLAFLIVPTLFASCVVPASP